MADIFWPSGVGDDPLIDSVSWKPLESGAFVNTGSGIPRGAPRNIGQAINMQATYPMSAHQFNGLWLPWWLGRSIFGGAENGMAAFWLRDPFDRKPYRWQRQQGQEIDPRREGLQFLVTLALMRLPT